MLSRRRVVRLGFGLSLGLFVLAVVWKAASEFWAAPGPETPVAIDRVSGDKPFVEPGSVGGGYRLPIPARGSVSAIHEAHLGRPGAGDSRHGPRASRPLQLDPAPDPDDSQDPTGQGQFAPLIEVGEVLDADDPDAANAFDAPAEPLEIGGALDVDNPWDADAQGDAGAAELGPQLDADAPEMIEVELVEVELVEVPNEIGLPIQ